MLFALEQTDELGRIGDRCFKSLERCNRSIMHMTQKVGKVTGGACCVTASRSLAQDCRLTALLAETYVARPADTGIIDEYVIRQLIEPRAVPLHVQPLSVANSQSSHKRISPGSLMMYR